MAGRPRRFTVDYFPHYVKWGKTLQILESRYGNVGYAVWFKTLQVLGDTENHYFCASNDNNCDSNAEEWEYLLSKLLINEETAIEIYDLLARLNAIDKDLWQKKRIIWCQNFVDGLKEVYRKRGISVPEKPISATENTQRRGEGRGGDNNIINNIINKNGYGQFKNVLLTDDEYSKLKEKFNSNLEQIIENLSEYLESKGKKYKSHYATILNWHRRNNPHEDTAWKFR